MRSIKNILFIISYNQENYIKSCVDSLSKLTIKPNKIIWLDDGSTDNTIHNLKLALQDRNIDLKELIDIRINKINSGIYKNLNRAFDFDVEDFDYIHFLACDDWFIKCYFEDFNKYVALNVIEDNPHLVCSNHISVTQNNRYFITKYDTKIANIHGLIRNKFTTRNLGISRNLFLKIPKYDEDIGIWADRLFDCNMILNANKIYQMDGAHHNYRIGVGFSSRIDRKSQAESLKKVCKKILCELKTNLHQKDIKYLEYLTSYANVQIKYNCTNIIIFIFNFIINIYNGAMLKDLKIFIPKFLFQKIKNIYYG